MVIYVIYFTWESGQFLSISKVLDSNLDFRELIEDIKFGQVEAIVSVYQGGVLHNNKIEPATASSAACCSSVLATDFLEVRANILYIWREVRSLRSY